MSENHSFLTKFTQFKASEWLAGMIIKASDDKYIISARSFDGHELIDGGDTIVVKFKCADDETIDLVIPRKELDKMIDNIYNYIIKSDKKSN